MRLIKADKKVTVPSFNVKSGVSEQKMRISEFIMRYTKEGLLVTDMVNIPEEICLRDINLEAYTQGWIDGRKDLLESTTVQAVNENKKLMDALEEIQAICEEV